MRDIPGYEGIYAVSEDGRVWSYPKPSTGCVDPSKVRPGRWLKPIDSRGYKYVNLGAKNMNAIHRIVALTYHGEPPEGRGHVNHKDGNKANNRFDNLEWCSQAENNRHAWRAGLVKPCRGLTKQQALEARSLYADGGCTQKALSERYGVGRSTVQRAINGTHGY